MGSAEALHPRALQCANSKTSLRFQINNKQGVVIRLWAYHTVSRKSVMKRKTKRETDMIFKPNYKRHDSVGRLWLRVLLESLYLTHKGSREWHCLQLEGHSATGVWGRRGVQSGWTSAWGKCLPAASGRMLNRLACVAGSLPAGTEVKIPSDTHTPALDLIRTGLTF